MRNQKRFMIFATAVAVVLAVEQQVYYPITATSEEPTVADHETKLSSPGMERLDHALKKMFFHEPYYKESLDEDKQQLHMAKLEDALKKLIVVKNFQEKKKLWKFVIHDLVHLRGACGRDMMIHCLNEMAETAKEVIQKQLPRPRLHVLLTGMKCLDEKYTTLSFPCKKSIETLPSAHNYPSFKPLKDYNVPFQRDDHLPRRYDEKLFVTGRHGNDREEQSQNQFQSRHRHKKIYRHHNRNRQQQKDLRYPN